MRSQTFFLSKILRSRPVVRYLAALGVTAAALLIRYLLNPVLGDYIPYISLFPAVAFAAWYCGVGPSLLSAVSAAIGAQFLFVSSHSFRHASLQEWLGLAAFLLVSAILAAMGEGHRQREDVLLQAREELEKRVDDRTRELDAANRGLRDLTARLLQLQDEERRRIARELHDSVGQLLAALGMNLATVGGEIQKLMNTARTLSDSEALVGQMTQEIRTISHLLHPPLLDEAGLASALRWYTDGFAARSKIKVDLEFADELGRLPRELETTVFRVVQECLTNVHRHSESQVAKVRVVRSGKYMTVDVVDNGKGIPGDKQSELASTGTPGVGIRGMRERIRQLGGELEIHSNGKGTRVSARLPLASPSSVPADAA